MKRLGCVVLSASASVILGCASEDPAPEPTAIQRVQKKFDGQAVALLPFDPDRDACLGDPELMEPPTLASCAWLDGAKLPANLTVTKDPRAFDPAPDRSMMLVVWGASLDPDREGWVGIVGLGPKPKAPEPLVESASSLGVRPQFVPLIIGGVILLDEIGVAALLFGATAVVATHQMQSQQRSEPLVRRTEGLITGQTQLLNCPEDEHRDLATRQREVCRTLPGGCERFLRSPPAGAAICGGLTSRRDAYDSCRVARQNVVDRCFNGQPDATHQRELNDMQRIVSECNQSLARMGC